MAGSAVSRMKNFQIFLFCSADVVSLILNGGILLLVLINKKTRAVPSNLFFISIIAFHLVTALCGINFAVQFKENNADSHRKDTVIVQITFTLLGLGLSHFMLTVDRIMSVLMQERYPLVMGEKQIWLMIALSWFIPTVTAISSAAIATNGQPASQVSYALAILTVASGLTAIIALIGLHGYLIKLNNKRQDQPYQSTRRLRRAIMQGKANALPSRICMAMAISYTVLMFPQILFALGKLSKARGLLDVWYIQLSSTLMLCSGIVDAALYVYMNKELRNCIREKFVGIFRNKERSREKDMMALDLTMKDIDGKSDIDHNAIDTLLLKNTLKKDTEITML